MTQQDSTTDPLSRKREREQILLCRARWRESKHQRTEK